MQHTERGREREREKKNPSSSGFEKKEVCYIEGGLEMIRRSAKNPRPIGLKRHRSSSERRSVLSAALCRGCQVCGCEGCGNRFTLEYGNRIHTFTCYLLGFPPDFHTVSIPVTLESKEEIGLCGASTVEIFKLVSLGGRFRVQGGDQQIAPLNVCIAQAHTLLIERVLKRVCWDLEQHNTSTWFGSYLRNR